MMIMSVCSFQVQSVANCGNFQQSLRDSTWGDTPVVHSLKPLARLFSDINKASVDNLALVLIFFDRKQ
ncbi:hypothetical protein FGO68_gene7604 [Halteria grandinella]|uniref:Uncharacterized protein n=1 Tax=Halteria grandinella TaxID=5974 RepID=A0A8J8NM69_HALGN|nr:hypothetical protein FGO68_gene7604 [Halteria grandinella]